MNHLFPIIEVEQYITGWDCRCGSCFPEPSYYVEVVTLLWKPSGYHYEVEFGYN